MRQLLTSVLLLLFFSGTAHAQEPETLFGSSVDHGGYGAVSLRMSSIQGSDVLLVGGYGGWLIDHRLMLGGGGYGLVTDVRASQVAQDRYNPEGDPLYVDFGYGGFMMEYMIAPNDLIHVNVQALIGGGAVSYRESWYNDDDDWFDDDRRYGGTDVLFVVEPAVHAEINMTSWFRIMAGVSYRYVSGLDELRGIDTDDLRGIAGNLTFKFGAF
jgi:hypothetical protein